MKKPTIFDLPKFIVLHILKNNDVQHKIQFSATCKLFRKKFYPSDNEINEAKEAQYEVNRRKALLKAFRKGCGGRGFGSCGGFSMMFSCAQDEGLIPVTQIITRKIIIKKQPIVSSQYIKQKTISKLYHNKMPKHNRKQKNVYGCLH